LSQESKTIEFASIGLMYIQIFKSEWLKVNTGRLRDLTLKAAISMLFLILFSCLRFPESYGCYLFNATGITSFRHIELTLCTNHRLKVKSVNYLQFTPFCIFHPKVPSKHKTKNVKAFYIWNIDKTLVKCGWNYQIIWLHHYSRKLKGW
jgi:hypothetical protein